MQAALLIVIILQILPDIQLPANAETYVIPLSLNPFIQSPIELTGTHNLFYKQDPNFFSKVTLTDVSYDTKENLREMIKKKLGVVFMTVASSYVDGSFTKSDLRYLSGSKWSYNISVEELLAASDGSITKLSQEMELYKFQELGMKFLEKRYNFNMSNIQSQLSLSRMEFLGASEEQWINIVGIITAGIVNNRSEKLNLSPCYLAQLLNKTEKDIAAFTLNEVDEHIYNISYLDKKLPEFKENVLATIFNVTAVHLANLSGLNITMVNSTGLQDQIQILTKSMLQTFHLSIEEIAAKYGRRTNDILTPCPDEWKSFQIMVVQEAFEKQATNMSITNKTLASLIQLPYANISKLSLKQMEHLIETTIRKVKEMKDIIEQKKLNNLMKSHPDVVDLKENAFSIIEAVTNFSKTELSLIYGWEDAHYLFAELFSIVDLVHSCSVQVYNNTLLELAEINTGEDTEHSMCNTFQALRNIWEKETLNEMERKFGNQLSNSSIETMLLSLTGGNITLINRVLNLSDNAQALCANVTLNHISMATSHSTMQLKQKSFQYIIGLAEELKANRSLFQSEKMKNTISPVTSTILSSMHTRIKMIATTMTEAMMVTKSKIKSTISSDTSRVASSVQIGITTAETTNTDALMMTTNRIQSMITSVTSRTVSLEHTGVKIAATTLTEAIKQHSLKTDDSRATRNVNATVTAGFANFTIQPNSTEIPMTTRIANTPTVGLVGSANEVPTKRYIFVLTFSLSMNLVLI